MKGNKGSARLDVFTCRSFLERSRQPSRRLTFEMNLAVTSPYTSSSHATFSSSRFDLHTQPCAYQSLPSETPCTWSAGQIHNVRSFRHHDHPPASANIMAEPDNAYFSREQQDQSQQASPNTSSPSTTRAESQTFEATTAVLDTNELLHLIISAVPREHRTSLRRVSKNWQAAVLKIGHVFEPIDYDVSPYGDDFATEFDYYGYGPVYALENEFALNPMLRCSS